MAEDHCRRCGAGVCQTCATYRNEVAFCPECVQAGTPLLRDLEIESHIRAVAVLDGAAAVAVAGYALLSGHLWLLAPAPLLALQCWALRRYFPAAGLAQVLLGVAACASLALVRNLSQLGGALSLAFLGSFSIWVVANERGRECFTSYYRETVRQTTQKPPWSFLLAIAIFLALIEAGVRYATR